MDREGTSQESLDGDILLSDERIHVTGAGDIETASAHSLVEPEAKKASQWTIQFRAISEPVSRFHQRTPVLKRLPSFVLLPIAILFLVNCLIWAVTGIILRYHPYLLSF